MRKKEVKKVVGEGYAKKHNVTITKMQAVLVIAILVIGGIGGIVLWHVMQTEEQPKVTSIVRGNVALDEPIVDATISIYGLDGNKISEEKESTHPSGFFMVEVKSLPDNFKIVATGGTLDGEPFEGAVVRHVRDFNESTYYNLNAITTLIAAYMDKHPDMAYADAENVVENFLEMPSETDIKDVIANDDYYSDIFCHESFMIEANNAGGFNAFVDILVGEIDSGVDNHTFHGGLVGIGVGDALNILKYAFSGIAGTVIAVKEGHDIGWVFRYVFDGEGQKLDAMSAQLDQIESTLRELQRGQAVINQKLDALSKQIADGFAALKQQLETMQEELARVIAEEGNVNQLKNRRGQLIESIKDPTSHIMTAFSKLNGLSEDTSAAISDGDDKRLEECQDSARQYMDQILGIYGIESDLNKLKLCISDFLGEAGLLSIWSTLAAKGVTSNDNLTYLYQCFEDRFAYLLGLELQGITLVIDAIHGKYGENSTQAVSFWNNWKTIIGNQLNESVTCVEKIVCSRIDTVTAKELGKIDYTETYYAPVILPMADRFAHEILSGVSDKNESTTGKGLLTARVVNFPSFSGMNLQPVDTLDIRFANVTTYQNYAATGSNRVYRTGVTYPNPWGEVYPYEIIHYNYGWIPLGTYKLIYHYQFLYSHAWDQNTIIDTENQTYSRSYMAYLSPDYAKWGSSGSNHNQFSAPQGVAVDRERNVYVTDTGNNCIKKFDYKRNYITSWGSHGTGNGQFSSPKGIAVGPGETIYVVDAGNNRVQKFDFNGNFIAKWGSKGTGNGQFDWPTGIAVDSSGYVYVIDANNERVQKFDSNGIFITKWGSFGSEGGTGEEHFRTPFGIFVDTSGYVYVTDTDLASCVRKFDSSGNFITMWGTWGSGNGQFDDPYGIAVDRNGNVYVADTENNRVQRFDSNGKFIAKWGSQGTGDKQFKNPCGIAMDCGGSLYVVDSRNNRIQFFRGPIVELHTYTYG
ncbi:MAG: 6-bladed beta-propeller [Desulfobacterales bacterium]|nr:6-bladed beta-propeller [Desulfobacterales bacterium]